MVGQDVPVPIAISAICLKIPYDNLGTFSSYAENHRDGGSGLAPWPARLTTPPPRLADFGISTGTFEKDMVNNLCNM